MSGLDLITRVDTSALGIYINVQSSAYGAVGDGVTDDRTAIQAADTAAALIGATVYFPAPAAFYLVTGSVRPSSGVTWRGDGYGSQIKCPDDGWLAVATVNMGIVNIDNETNVRITGLRITGTKIAPIDAGTDGGFPRSGHTPKLIYLEGTSGADVADGIMIDHCWLDNSAWEGIWQGGAIANNLHFQITNNQFRDIDGPSAITLNGEKSVVSNNIFTNCPLAIGVIGRHVTITTNQIYGAVRQGIGVGEIGTGGFVDVSGNIIQITPNSTDSWGGIYVNGATTNGTINIGPNVIQFIHPGGAMASGAAITAKLGGVVDIHDNSVQGDVAMTGIQAECSINSEVSIRSNTVVLTSESATPNQSRGIVATVSANTLKLQSADNKVIGLTVANGNYAYDYRANGGTIITNVSGDLATGGYVKISDRIYNDTTTPSTINIPLYESAPDSAFSSYTRNARLALLNLLPPQDGEQIVIASGVVTLTASGSSGFPFRQTRITIDTQSAAATDDVDTINGGQDGDVLIVRSVDDGRNVVVKHNTGNILCGGIDCTLGTRADRITLLYDGTLSKWVEIARNNPVGIGQDTGWSTSTGTANKGAYATYAGQDVTATYVEAEAQATDDAVKAASQRIKALEDAMRSLGLIN